MKYFPAIIMAAIWFDGVGFGAIVGMAIESRIEGHGISGYAPKLAVILVVLVVLVVLLRIMTRTPHSGRA
jgi:hypothetical protein